LLLPLFARINPGDITIRHHFTQQPFRLHSFKHKGYWFHGAKREQSTMALFAKLINPGDVVVEVGGHIGYIAVYFSHLVGKEGRVIVFEPGPNNLPYLRKNTATRTNVTVIERAVGRSEGEFPFYIENLTGQNNTLVKTFEGFHHNRKHSYVDVGYETVIVPVVRLDNILQTIPTVNFVKIDVEGAEADVLSGGHEFIQQHRPILMVECNNTAHALWEFLQAAGYWVFTPNKTRIHNVSAFANGNHFCLHPQWHTVPLQAHFGMKE